MRARSPENKLAERRRVVEAFVLRARRVAAHSLPTEEPELLGRLASGEFKVQIAANGTTSMHHVVPKEEAFESLASRLRPFDLGSESIHFIRVVQRLHTYLTLQSPGEAAGVRQQLVALRKRWRLLTTQTGDQLFPQVARGTGSLPTSMRTVPMRTLAAGWMYRDLAHYDLKEDKRIVAEFPVRDRYLSAVQYYSGMALIILDLLELVRGLARRGWVDVSPGCWDEEVVAGDRVEHPRIQILVAPAEDAPEASIPALISGEAAGSWEELTKSHEFSPKHRRDVEIVCLGAGGGESKSFSAIATFTRTLDRSAIRIVMELPQRGIFTIDLPVVADGEQKSGTVNLSPSYQNNRGRADWLEFEIALASSSLSSIRAGENIFMDLPAMGLLSSEELHLSRKNFETARALVTLEEHDAKELPLIEGPITLQQRRAMEQAAAIIRGEVVQGYVPQGRNTFVIFKHKNGVALGFGAISMEVLGVEVPLPAGVMTTPGLSIEPNEDAKQEPTTTETEDRVSFPEDGTWYAWDPHQTEWPGVHG